METNKIFLDVNKYLPIRNTKDGMAASRDGSAFPFIIEQFISVAITDIYLDDTYKKYSDTIPQSLRKRVHYFDTRRSASRAIAVLKPIFEEFEVYPDDYGVGLTHTRDIKVESDIVFSIHTLLSDLIDFFCGIEKKLTIDIKIDRLLTTINKLRVVCKSGSSRAVLVYMEGLFSSYKANNMTSILLLPPTTNRIITVFNEFVEDALYQELSNSIHITGIPTFSLKIFPKIKRLVKEIASKAPFKQIADISLKTISTVTSIPLPNSTSISDAITAEYFPPVTVFSPEIKRGLDYWWLVEPEPIIPNFMGYAKDDFEDWKSLKEQGKIKFF
jgi:hypothetical protein